MKTIGLDVGGTKILGIRFDQAGKVEARLKVSTESNKGRDQVLGNLLGVIEKLKDDQVENLGLALPGFVDADKGVIKKLPNVPGLEDFDIVNFLETKTGLKIKIGNDARLFALAEQRVNFAKSNSALGIIIGTGVGSGFILNGNIYKGAHNFAGEIGHQCVDGNEVESIIAGKGLEALFEVTDLSDLDLSKIDEVKLERPLEVLSQWLTNQVFAFDPDVIVIGGGAGIHFWAHFKEEIINSVNKKLAGYPVELNLQFSNLENAGVVGARFLFE